MDKRFNRTMVTLVPKRENAKTIIDFRPISYCTTVYKIISKIMSNRLGKVLNCIVSRNQAAFVPGQKIQDHVLLAYELIKGYNRKSGMPGVCFRWTSRRPTIPSNGMPCKLYLWSQGSLGGLFSGLCRLSLLSRTSSM